MKTENFILLSEKEWHDNLFIKLAKTYPEYGWHYVSKKEDFNIELLNRVNPRYVFIPHWSYIIDENIFNAFECIVFHMTDLPYGRGGSPLQNLIVRGHKDTKVSALRVSEGIDSGPIYLKEDLSLQGSAIEIFMNMNIVIEKMIGEIISRRMEPQSQIGHVIQFKRRTPNQSNIIDKSDLNEVYDYIRMLDCEGYPKAFIENETFKFEFHNAEIFQNEISANVRIIKK